MADYRNPFQGFYRFVMVYCEYLFCALKLMKITSHNKDYIADGIWANAISKRLIIGMKEVPYFYIKPYKITISVHRSNDFITSV